MKLIIMSHSEMKVLTSVELLLMHTDGLKNGEQQELQVCFKPEVQKSDLELDRCGHYGMLLYRLRVQQKKQSLRLF